MLDKFFKKDKGQTSLEILIVMGGLIIIAVVVVTIILASSKSKVSQITDADRQNTEIIDKTLFPPNINSLYCSYSNNQVTYNLSVIPSVTKDLSEYCLVVNGVKTDHCVPSNQTQLTFTSSDVGNGNYKVALVSKNIQNAISSNSVSFSCKVDLPSGYVPELPNGTEYPNIVNFSCPLGYSRVPGIAEYNTNYTNGGFCVMTWEAKMDFDEDTIGDTNYECINCFSSCTTKPYFYTTWDLQRCPVTAGDKPIVSTAEGMPVANTNLNSAKAHCSALGPNYHLITNEEWMTVARNLEQQPENWIGGVVGVESLKVGNTVYTSSLKGYLSGAQVSVPSQPIYWAGANHTIYRIMIDFKESPSSASRREINSTAKLVLSTGDDVWDFSGNMMELVDKTMLGSQLPRHDIVRKGYWVEFDELESPGTLEEKEFMPALPITSVNGAGQIKSDWFLTSEVLFIRGGGAHWYESDYSDFAGGIYSLYLIQPNSSFPTTSIYLNRGRGVGFRCVYIP